MERSERSANHKRESLDRKLPCSWDCRVFGQNTNLCKQLLDRLLRYKHWTWSSYPKFDKNWISFCFFQKQILKVSFNRKWIVCEIHRTAIQKNRIRSSSCWKWSDVPRRAVNLGVENVVCRPRCGTDPRAACFPDSDRAKPFFVARSFPLRSRLQLMLRKDELTMLDRLMRDYPVTPSKDRRFTFMSLQEKT